MQQTLLGRVVQHTRFQEINSDLMIPQECAKSDERDSKSNHSPEQGAEQGAFVCAHNLFNAQLGLAIYILLTI